MPKITAANYHVSEILPLQWVKTFTGGANNPILIRGVDTQQYQPGDFVLKYRGAERMDETACRRELLASFIAAEMDIAVPEPVIIRVDRDFIKEVPMELQTTMTSNALGINFGCRYIPHNATFPPAPRLPVELHQTAARIFAFDLLLQNADRNNKKPNSFLAESKIYVYDHELSFGFLSMLPIFANPTPWVLNDTDVNAAKQHLFYPALCQNRNVNWDAAVSTIDQLTPHFWQRATELIPAPWKNSEETTRIHAHIDAIQQHSQTFISEICNKLLG